MRTFLVSLFTSLASINCYADMVFCRIYSGISNGHCLQFNKDVFNDSYGTVLDIMIGPENMYSAFTSSVSDAVRMVYVQNGDRYDRYRLHLNVEENQYELISIDGSPRATQGTTFRFRWDLSDRKGICYIDPAACS